MSLFQQKLLCPFCFNSFAASDMLFRCMTPSCPGKEQDLIYAQTYGSGPTLMGHIIRPTRSRFSTGTPHEAVCGACTTVSYTPVCPRCHYELTHDMGQIDQRIIAIIGGRATGKTHYIASLINRLQHDTGKQFDLTVRMLGDTTQRRWEEDFYTPLFVHKTLLQPNQPAEIDAQIKIPLIFRLTFNYKQHRKALNISFFDTAGEDMTSLTTMSIQNRYISHAHGIIFLLDPLQIPSVRQRLPRANLPPVDPKAAPEYIVSRLRDLFERENHISPTQKVNVPLAFTVSKIDTLFPILEPDSELHHPSEHRGTLDLDSIQSVHGEIEQYLTTWISPNFSHFIADSFSCYIYSGVSSLGTPPDQQNRLSQVSPLRVEDPFLWLLYQMKLIKGTKRV